MDSKHRHALPTPKKKNDDAADIIWGNVSGTYETQAISDTTFRQPDTHVAIPADHCINDSKEWVDFNEK